MDAKHNHLIDSDDGQPYSCPSCEYVWYYRASEMLGDYVPPIHFSTLGEADSNE